MDRSSIDQYETSLCPSMYQYQYLRAVKMMDNGFQQVTRLPEVGLEGWDKIHKNWSVTKNGK